MSKSRMVMLMIAMGMVMSSLAVRFAAGPQGSGSAQAAEGAETPIVHDVYFSLKDKSAASTQKMVDACKKYLKPQAGVTFFAVGVLAAELNRPVNDLDWDIGLHVVFKDKASHDKYQDDAEHKKFIDENKENWAKVRVFDTLGK